MIPLQIIDTFNLFTTIVIVTVLVLIYFLYIGIRIARILKIRTALFLGHNPR